MSEPAGASAPAEPRLAPTNDRITAIAREALLENTDARNIGPYVRTLDEGDGVVSVLFESALPGYPGWKWTVSIATIGDAEPTVMESELMPGEGSLLAPDWVPWSERLEEWQAAQAAAAAAAADAEDDEDDDDELDADPDELDSDPDDLGDDVYDGVDVETAVDGHDESDDDEHDDSDDDDDDDEHDDDEHDDEHAAGHPDAVAGGASAAGELGVEQAEQAEAETDEAGPDEPAAPVRRQRRRRKGDDQGD